MSATWQSRADGRGCPPGIVREIEEAVDRSAGMAVSILMRDRDGMTHRELLVKQLEELAEGFRRRSSHPLGYDGDLEAARSLAVSVLAERIGAGTPDILESEYGLSFGDEEEET